jgi:hypothetical protein
MHNIDFLTKSVWNLPSAMVTYNCDSYIYQFFLLQSLHHSIGGRLCKFGENWKKWSKMWRK